MDEGSGAQQHWSLCSSALGSILSLSLIIELLTETKPWAQLHLLLLLGVLALNHPHLEQLLDFYGG